MYFLSRILAAQDTYLFCLVLLAVVAIALICIELRFRMHVAKVDAQAISRGNDVLGEAHEYFDDCLQKDLPFAADLDQFYLQYQVQTQIRNAEICGYEALLRWEHPLLGTISPEIFIPIAEQSGSIVEIGKWVLKTACREAAAWNGTHKIAVNVSAVQIADPNFPILVHQTLLETGLAASRLELELTESALVVDKIRALHVLRQIKALGVAIALDDFGAGYASLETLRSFPFDRIKIDRSFIEEIESSLRHRKIVRTIIALGRALEIPVLAEGIESQLQLSVLAEERCDEVQGFYLGRPSPIPQAAVDFGKFPFLAPNREFKSFDAARRADGKNPILAVVATAGSLTSLQRSPNSRSDLWAKWNEAS